MSDTKYMAEAIELALKGEGYTNPNPMVGAVILKNGEVIGRGYHHKYGDLHAERDALRDCYSKGNDPKGATIYVTLEPCCHTGKQPPCTEALVEAGITKVIIGSRDPNPLVSGKGVAYLKEHGLEVVQDFMKSECDAINEVFFHYITTKTPYIALKYAMTLDGKIATYTGDSKWITGERSREFVQKLRNKYAGIMVGINTVLMDDPLLNCRLVGGNSPTRIILDSKAQLPLNSRIVQTCKEYNTILAYVDAPCNKLQELEDKGITLLKVQSKDGRVDIKDLMTKLGELKIDSILVEGGSEVNFSMIKSGFVNKLYAFLGPLIVGGKAKSPVGGEGFSKISEALKLKMVNTTRFGDDILIEYKGEA